MKCENCLREVLPTPTTAGGLGLSGSSQIIPPSDRDGALKIAIESLLYIANSIPGPEQIFEIENKIAAQRALTQIQEILGGVK